MLTAALKSACHSLLQAFSPSRDIMVMLLHTFPPHCRLHFPGEWNLKPQMIQHPCEKLCSQYRDLFPNNYQIKQPSVPAIIPLLHSVRYCHPYHFLGRKHIILSGVLWPPVSNRLWVPGLKRSYLLFWQCHFSYAEQLLIGGVSS